ncbi:MAG: hypothetical protein IKD75_08505 [Prevotella sp.]|nr:hypothetical protein [Prevotella sp.]
MNVSGDGGGTYQTKSVTPSESAQVVTADAGYDALEEVDVAAISSTYVGTGITRRDSTNLSASGKVITAPAGYYSSSASYTMTEAQGFVGSPSVNSSGLITATYTVTGAGYQAVASTSNTTQMTTQGAQTIHPSTSDQTIAASRYLTGAQTIKAVTTSNLTAANIKNGVTVTVGDSTDADCVASVTGTYEGGGGSGWVTESGTVTPTANTNTISVTFANTHSTSPVFVALADISAPSSDITSNTNLTFCYVDYYKLFGSGYPTSTSATRYSTAYYTYRGSSSASSSAQNTQYSSDNTGSSSTSYSRYWASSSGFKAYCGTSTRYWKSGRTYKWIAVWMPTT